MSPLVFLIVLLGAALHATWNAIVKRGDNTLFTTVLVTGAAALVAAIALPFLPQPAAASWPFITASTLLQLAYFTLVAQTYRITDMGLAYPLMRGTAPLLVSLASLVLLREPLAPAAWIGIGIICVGILGMALQARRDAPALGLAMALLNAAVIAAYTLIDGIGVRKSGAPAAYTLWIFLSTGFVLPAWALLRHRAAFTSYIRRNWSLGLGGGIGTVVSYGLALWAMTTAPVAIVAALRETSILFGTVISGLVLHEKVSRVRIAGACLIVAGAIALRLA